MNWSQAFARQAASDLAARDCLINDKSLAMCHSLHHLQMACEKLCKAAMIAAGLDPSDVQRSHAHIAKQLPILIQAHMSKQSRQKVRGNWIVDAIRPLARKIELLNPAVRDGGRSPENCEYPWPLPDGTIVAPADHKFDVRALYEPAGMTLLKIVRELSVALQK